ncbi:MAG: hypothetical protein ACR2M7_05075 [Bdellovibrionales bacterium]
MKHLTHLTFILLFVTACGYAPPASQPPTSSQNSYGQQYQQGPYNQQPYAQQPPVNNPYAQQQVYYNAYGNPVASTSGGNLPNRGDDDDEEEEEDDDDDRDRNVKTCKDYSTCKEICEDIFKDNRDEKKCGRLSRDDAEDLKDVFVAFQDVELEDIKEESLAIFVKISLEPLIKEARNRRSYSRGDAKDVLTYIVDDDDITELFAKEDSDFRFLEALLSRVDDNVVHALSEDKDDSFMGIAIYNENEEALDWVRGYFEEGTGSYNRDCDSLSSSNKEACVFDKYCRLAKDLPTDIRKYLIGASANFEDLLEDVGLTTVTDDYDYKNYCGADPVSVDSDDKEVTVSGKGKRYYSCTSLNDPDNDIAEGTERAYCYN